MPTLNEIISVLKLLIYRFCVITFPNLHLMWFTSLSSYVMSELKHYYD